MSFSARVPRLGPGLMLASLSMTLACGGRTLLDTPGADAGAPADAMTAPLEGGDGSPPVQGDGGPGPRTAVTKVDLLFLIDNSPSMGDKQALLALSIPGMLGRLMTPNCVDARGVVVGPSTVDGVCPAGAKTEFPPVHDIHLGMVTSSLGSRGGDVCPDGTPNPVNMALSAHDDDQGRLVNRGGVAGDPTVEEVPGTPDAPSPLGFLSYFPSVSANAGRPPPPTPAVTTPSQLVSDFTTLVEGVHEHGCGFEAQNEAWYRFLVQPDPFASVTVAGGRATLSGVDEVILQQRAAFLRPDSAVAVIVVTDENEEAADPLAIKSQGWAFNQSSFPGSQSGGGAPEGTIECQQLDPVDPLTTGPNDPNCTSCAFVPRTDPSFAARCPKDGMNGNAGYLDPANDALNLRFFHPKMRFGATTAYPVARYVRGLQKPTVPSVGLAYAGDTDHEHDADGNYIGTVDAQANCTNPLFATSLPTRPSQDLCHLARGPRTPDMIYYVAIAGVPHQLLQLDPAAPLSPQKTTLSDADWTLLLGRDPEHYDFRGADFHMIESTAPRTVNTGGWASVATCTPPAMGPPSATQDPINGCEFDSRLEGTWEDLQFACIFPLVAVDGTGTIQPLRKDCTAPQYARACDCAQGAIDQASQLCDPNVPTTQVYGKAYPSLRELAIARAMATETVDGYAYDQGVVSSLCPITLDLGQPIASAGADPLFGYNPAMAGLIARLAPSLGR